MNTHSCIKPGCGVSYEDNDPDAYYCPSCVVEKKRIAAEIDARVGSRPRKEVKSRFSAKDFIGSRGQLFFHAKDL